ncbi:MAG TPA: response regulator [Puia sp.]|nr:response regulator [Puia sp.]
MKKILLIDNDPLFRSNIAEILSLSHYEVVLAETAKAGIETALTNRPDLIICDTALPAADGYTVLHSMQHDPHTSGIPFILLTGTTEKEDWRKAMAMGADDYLTKPVDGVELLRAVETCLRKEENRKKTAIPAATTDETVTGENEAFLEELAQRTAHPYRKKQVIYLEGQRPAFVYFVVSGKVKVYRSDPDGKDLITDIHSAGDFFGYPALLEGKNFSDNAQALEDSGIVQIPRQEFTCWMSSRPEIARRFIHLLSREAAAREARFLNLAYNSLRKRVANGLLQLASVDVQQRGHKEALAISRENLANIVGCATESLTRTLSDFRSEKLVDIRNGRIYLLDESKLRNLIN